MAQLVRAPPCHGGGRGFKSLWGRFQFILWDLSSAGRASALQAEGHRFEPCRSHLIEYVCYKYGRFPEWPKGTDCKSAANCFGGSNPPPPIFFNIAGWSSLEARRAHNPEVGGSNPSPATPCPDSSVGRAED